jgi:hypothetical protein
VRCPGVSFLLFGKRRRRRRGRGIPKNVDSQEIRKQEIRRREEAIQTGLKEEIRRRGHRLNWKCGG